MFATRIDICFPTNRRVIGQIGADGSLGKGDGNYIARGTKQFLRVFDSQQEIAIINILKAFENQIAEAMAADAAG